MAGVELEACGVDVFRVATGMFSGTAVIPVIRDGAVTLKLLGNATDSVLPGYGLVTVTVRWPTVASDATAITTYASVADVKKGPATVVIPGPKSSLLVPINQCVLSPLSATCRFGVFWSAEAGSTFTNLGTPEFCAAAPAPAAPPAD